MLIIFKSKAAAEIVMYKEHARRILDLLNKDVEQGIITTAELPAAIASIEAAIAESKIHSVSTEVAHDVNAHQNENDDEHEKPATVSFATRAFPVLEMLQAAQKMQKDVVWGV
ncbi:DUF1840 domain-containing protein [Undibacterium aquatile]|uniref:DUF1840 domain-containing protein n=1 Tax=Undibacterium aquatile TaxID=1537398 RepID=A0ABR6XAX4_9BURK|nr:DUF1840 domain-containing protein [Undibacterium aquatile]MBC3810066.1 DUF1840 domain-containing protein [Undibacterium aquatile]